MNSTHLSLLASAFILIKVVSTQYTGSNLHYQPARITFSNDEWFGYLLSENSKHTSGFPARISDELFQWDCDRTCWESEYTHSYFKYPTGQCLCILDEPYIDNYNISFLYSDAPPAALLEFAKLSFLNANFESLDCIGGGPDATNPFAQYIHLEKVEDCIASCGNPTTQRPNIYSVASPTSYVVGPENDFTIVDIWDCACYSTDPGGSWMTCSFAATHIYARHLHA